MRRAAYAGGLLVLAIGLAVFVAPFLTREREFLTTTPQPRPLTAQALIELPAGQQACIDNAVIDEHSERALIRVGTYGAPPSPLRLTVTAPALHEVERVPPTYQDSITTSVPVDPPPDAVVATVCLRNEGARAVALYAGADRHTRSTTRVEGAPADGNFELTFAEGGKQTLLERLPVVFERMQPFRPDALWLVWLVAVLFVIGVPLAVVWAFASAVHADDERSIRATPRNGAAQPRRRPASYPRRR